MMATASRRRSRKQIEDDEEEEVFLHSDGESRSPASETRPGKRYRTTVTTEDEEEGLEDVDQGIEYEEDAEDDGGDSDMEATQREGEQLRRRIADRQKRDADRSNGQCVIKSIELFNFMCHKRLEINFGDKINFIIGHNGSGKSAILTALTICLGGKASDTNRGGSAKDLIKEGENNASVIVSLRNEGEDAYKHDVYGDTISIERKLSKEGSGGYTIRAHSGAVVSRKREELTEILDHVQLQVDNPMTVLTQDTARLFLGNSSTKDKYNLFMRGVQLTSLDNDYQVVEEEIGTVENTLTTKLEALEDLKRLEEEARTKVKVFEEASQIEEEISTLQKHFAWGQVKAQEAIVAEREETVAKLAANIQKAEEKRDEEQGKLDEHDIRVQEAKDSDAECVKREEAASHAVQAAKTEVNQCRASLKELRESQTSLEREVLKCEATINENQKKIDDERAKEDDTNERAQQEAELRGLESSINNFSSRIVEIQADQEKVKADGKKANSDYNAADQRVKTLEASINGHRSAIQDLQRAKTSRLSVFHNSMPNVVAEIQRLKSRFRDPPIGPLGAYIKIRDEKWANIVEVLVGRNLNGFLVTNEQDRATLRAILEQKRCDVPIIISQREMFDYHHGEPDPRFVTVLNLLEFTDENVKRQLIDQNKIESTILIESHSRADEVMYSRPENVFACFALNPDYPGAGYRVGGLAGGSSTQPIWAAKNRVPKLTNRNLDVQINEKQEELAEDERKLVTARDELTRLSNRKNDLLREARALNQALAEARAGKDRVSDQADTLREALYASQPTDSGVIAAYESAIEDAQSNRETFLLQIVPIREEIDKKVEEYKVLNKAVKDREADQRQVATDHESAKELLNAVTHARVQLNVNIGHWGKKIQDNTKAHDASVASLEEAKSALVETIAGATVYCPERVPNSEIKLSVDKIQQKLVSLKNQMTRMQQEAGMTEDEARENFFKFQNQYKMANHEMKSLNNLKHTLWTSTMTRRQVFERFRKDITIRAKTFFTHLLEQRGYHGKLIIDHRNHEIRVKVTPPGRVQSSTNKDAKQLSGGEKSFAQICLLLSVWEAMGSPIRALDEFDVFMDDVNRKMSMGMIIESARISLGRQFILITPQNMSNVTLGPDIRVHKMRDPERGQQTIDG